MTLQTGLFLLLLLASISFFALNARRLIGTLSIGKPDSRTDKPLDRLRNVLVVAFGQSKLLRDPVAGLMHFFIFLQARAKASPARTRAAPTMTIAATTTRWNNTMRPNL